MFHVTGLTMNLFFSICRLQDEYIQVQSELKTTIEETKLVQEKYKNINDQLKKDIVAKQSECDQLKSQVQVAHVITSDQC